jgi:hypothetical protein
MAASGGPGREITMSDQRHDAVSRRAYELWEQEGGEHGRHEDHWHRAAREVEEGVNVTAPDGTTMPVATAVEAQGQAAQEPADSPAAKPTRRRAVKPAGEPADSPAAATPRAAKAPAKALPGEKTPAKPRKPKAK